MYYSFKAMWEMRGEYAFYPPQNFHADSTINHEFSKGLLRELGFEPGGAYSEGAQLETIESDMGILGFTQQISSWRYPYEDYRVKRQFAKPKWILETYKRAKDFNTYLTSSAMSDRKAVVLSNSFGAFIAPHLAPAFKSLHHINLNNLQDDEAEPFFEDLLARVKPTDVIFVIHDQGLPNPTLEMLARQLDH